MLVHKFDTKQIADEAMNYLNVHHGLPVQGGLTKFDETSYKQHSEGYYYIVYSEEWTGILGEPIEVDLNTEK
jgi:hypothetical protein